jgi:hypothetical protein
VEKQKWKHLVIYAILSYIALTIHLTGAFLFMIGIVYFLSVALIPAFRPHAVQHKILVIPLVVLVGFAAAFIPRFIAFTSKWLSSIEWQGSWGSDVPMKVLYLATPSICFLFLAGVFLLIKINRREGLFLSVYCFLPFVLLSLAIIVGMNVSAKYLLFILPGLLLGASYLLLYMINQINLHKQIVAFAMIAAIVLPVLQNSYLYFTSDYGNRDRFNEAIQFIKQRRNKDDKFMHLALYSHTEGDFYFRTTAAVEGLNLEEAQIIQPSSPAEIDLRQRIWVVTNRAMSPNATGLRKWLADHARLQAEFPASRGPQDQTIRVYLHTPES